MVECFFSIIGHNAYIIIHQYGLTGSLVSIFYNVSRDSSCRQDVYERLKEYF